MKQAGRLLFLAGAVAIGLFLFRAAPREVTLVYALGDARASAVEVEIRRGGETVRRAEFRFPDGRPGQVHHAVRLTDGEYVAAVGVSGGGPPWHADRPFTVAESGTIVLPVAR